MIAEKILPIEISSVTFCNNLGMNDENMRLPINDHIEKLNVLVDSMENVRTLNRS